MKEYNIEYCFTKDHPVENIKLLFDGLDHLLTNLNNLKKVSCDTNKEGDKELVIKNEASGDSYRVKIKGNPDNVGSTLGDIILFICDRIIAKSKEEKAL